MACGLPRMLNYLTGHLDLPGHCEYSLVRSLMIKQNIIFPGSKKYHKGTRQYTWKIGKFLSEYLILKGNSEFILSIKSRTSQYLLKNTPSEHFFYRAAPVAAFENVRENHWLRILRQIFPTFLKFPTETSP